MGKISKWFLFLFFGLSFGASSEKNNAIWLDDLKIQTFSEGIASVLTIKPFSSDSILILLPAIGVILKSLL